MPLRSLWAVVVISLSLAASGATLGFSTYLGGVGDDLPAGVAADHSGNTIVVGQTSSPDFLGLASPKGGVDGFIVKLDASGKIVFRTLIGGSAADIATAVAVDGHDNIYVTGYSLSSDFPLKNAFQSVQHGSGDGFLMKLTSGGEVIYSTLLGGVGIDEPITVTADAAGNAFVAVLTNSPDLPLVNAAHTYPGSTQATTYLAKVSEDGSTLRYSTYLGGVAVDYPLAVRVDAAGNAYLGGTTTSANFPTTAGAWQTLPLNGDGFVVKFAPNGSIVFSTLFGGSGQDGIYALDVRNEGIYVSGVTGSRDFPTRNPLNPVATGAVPAFAAKFTAGGDLVYSTYLGDTGGTGVPALIAANSRGEAFVLFSSAAGILPTKNAIQPAHAGGLSDLYLLQLDASGSSMLFATYFGGSAADVSVALTVDDANRVVFCGRTTSPNLPLAQAAQPAYNAGTVDAFVSSLSFPQAKRRAVGH